MDVKNTFSKRIKKLRLQNNMYMAEFAKTIQLKKSRINMWENGNIIPHTTTLIRVSQYFNVSIDYLLGNEINQDENPKNERLQYICKSLNDVDDKTLEKIDCILRVMFSEFFNLKDRKMEGLHNGS